MRCTSWIPVVHRALRVRAAGIPAGPVYFQYRASHVAQPGDDSRRLRGVFSETCSTIYCSSWARDRLCRCIHESSPEVALGLLEDFSTDAGVWRNGEWARALSAAADPAERVDLVLQRFTQWYMARVAPKKVTMEEPWNWYREARFMKRRFYFHYGPTNSGKTFVALDALMKAQSGVYCAPLKALAGQVWRQINQRVPCDLLIGDERKFGGAAEHVSCTVEMTPVDARVEVGVIDEIQMLGDRDRGWAWTRALFGLPAREIHLCGEERAIHLVENLLYKTIEKRQLVLVKHERLTPLRTASSSLEGDLSRVRNGDCVVSFSRRNVVRLHERLERLGDVTASFVYGPMPFEVREKQVAQFNTGVREFKKNASGGGGGGARKHVLVSTDAIAYGLNMNIDRIIFAEMHKFDGKQTVPLSPELTKQISGRAGRFGLASKGDVGECTTLHPGDLPLLQQHMKSESAPLRRAGLLPSSDVLELYVELQLKEHREAGGTDEEPSFFTIVQRFVNATETTSLFFPADISRSILLIAQILDDIPQLPLKDRILFCYLPLSDSSDSSKRLLHTYASRHADHLKVDLLVDEVFDRLSSRFNQHRGCGLTNSEKQALLSSLEKLYRQAEMYAWLSWRFAPTFSRGEDAAALKSKCVALMEELLSH